MLVYNTSEYTVYNIRLLPARIALASASCDDNDGGPALILQKQRSLEKVTYIYLDCRSYHNGSAYERRFIRIDIC